MFFLTAEYAIFIVFQTAVCSSIWDSRAGYNHLFSWLPNIPSDNFRGRIPNQNTFRIIIFNTKWQYRNIVSSHYLKVTPSICHARNACSTITWQATGLDAWASRVKCPARFVSHLHEICIYIWVVYSLCFFCCLFITVTWWYVWCIEWASGNQEEVQACLVTLWLFIISCYSLYKTTLGLLCSWFENNPHFHEYSMDFHV